MTKQRILWISFAKMTDEEREALEDYEIDQDPIAIDLLDGKDDHDILALHRVNNLEEHKGMIEMFNDRTIITPIYEVNHKDPSGESFVGWARLRIRKMSGIQPFVVAYPFSS